MRLYLKNNLKNSLPHKTAQSLFFLLSCGLAIPDGNASGTEYAPLPTVDFCAKAKDKCPNEDDLCLQGALGTDQVGQEQLQRHRAECNSTPKPSATGAPPGLAAAGIVSGMAVGATTGALAIAGVVATGKRDKAVAAYTQKKDETDAQRHTDLMTAKEKSLAVKQAALDRKKVKDAAKGATKPLSAQPSVKPPLPRQNSAPAGFQFKNPQPRSSPSVLPPMLPTKK